MFKSKSFNSLGGRSKIIGLWRVCLDFCRCDSFFVGTIGAGAKKNSILDMFISEGAYGFVNFFSSFADCVAAALRADIGRVRFAAKMDFLKLFNSCVYRKYFTYPVARFFKGSGDRFHFFNHSESPLRGFYHNKMRSQTNE